MTFDLATLFTVIVFTALVAGGLLLLSWLQHRNVIPLALWSIGFFLCSAAMALMVSRGAIPDVWSVLVGNALVAGGYGVIWTGARSFADRRPIVLAALAGILIWIVACQVGTIYSTPEICVSLMSSIIAAYCLLA